MDEQDNIFKRIFGEKYYDDSRRLDDELLKIQEKYQLWFEQNNGEYEDGTKKSILDNRVLYNNGMEVIFKIDLENIPQTISTEIDEKFNEIFNQE